MKNMALALLLGLVGVPCAESQQQEDPVIDGYVTRVASSSDFDVNGYRVFCGAGTQSTIGQFQLKGALSNQGCPEDGPYLGEPTKIFGSLKKKEHAVEADRIAAQPVNRGEITGSAVIDGRPTQDSTLRRIPAYRRVRRDVDKKHAQIFALKLGPEKRCEQPRYELRQSMKPWVCIRVRRNGKWFPYGKSIIYGGKGRYQLLSLM